MGAYPFASPHTRSAPRLSTTSKSAELIADLPFLRNSVDVPAGMSAILEHTFNGVPSLGIWAQVPHYLGTMTYPAASAALLDGLTTVAGISVDASELRDEAVHQRQHVDQLVAGNDDHQAMVRQLESMYDAAPPTSFDGGMNQQIPERRRARRRDRALPPHPARRGLTTTNHARSGGARRRPRPRAR